jgi:hypothetical protein
MRQRQRARRAPSAHPPAREPHSMRNHILEYLIRTHVRAAGRLDFVFLFF